MLNVECPSITDVWGRCQELGHVYDDEPLIAIQWGRSLWFLPISASYLECLIWQILSLFETQVARDTQAACGTQAACDIQAARDTRIALWHHW